MLAQTTLYLLGIIDSDIISKDQPTIIQIHDSKSIKRWFARNRCLPDRGGSGHLFGSACFFYSRVTRRSCKGK